MTWNDNKLAWRLLNWIAKRTSVKLVLVQSMLRLRSRLFGRNGCGCGSSCHLKDIYWGALYCWLVLHGEGWGIDPHAFSTCSEGGILLVLLVLNKKIKVCLGWDESPPTCHVMSCKKSRGGVFAYLQAHDQVIYEWRGAFWVRSPQCVGWGHKWRKNGVHKIWEDWF